MLEKAFEIPKEIWKSRKLVWTLARNDFKSRFAGSYLGIVWALVQPIVTVLVYWFVFQVGLRQTATYEGRMPFCAVDAGRTGSLVLFSRRADAERLRSSLRVQLSGEEGCI